MAETLLALAVNDAGAPEGLIVCVGNEKLWSACNRGLGWLIDICTHKG